jgi:diguanylate cyclase (GGDEF)-like protein
MHEWGRRPADHPVGRRSHKRSAVENRILIVDDKADLRAAICEYMQMAGFSTESAGSVAEALRCMDAGPFDLVITDIVLDDTPGSAEGFELTKRIRKDYTADVIVMTGYGDFTYEYAVSIGASDFVIKPVRYEELLLRVKRVLRERALTEERARMMEKLHRLAITDGLTALFNSRYFYTQLELEVDRSSRYQHPLALLLIDIDHFKSYNDAFGHLEGDKVLVRFSQILKSCLRANDSAYRYGGEEFTVILPETGADEAKTVAQRIRAALEVEQFVPDCGQCVSKTISIGVTEYCPPEDAAAFIKRADQAMYLSKQNGRNRVSLLYAPQRQANASGA